MPPIAVEPSRNLVALITLVLVALLLFWGLGDLPFLSVNEARRAVTTREMQDAGQWLLPTMNGQLYLAKPPLFYWLALLSAQLPGGLSEWSMRLPSALFAAACCLALYGLARRLAGPRLALLAVLMLAANAGFSLFARRAEIEMSLAGLCFLALYCAWRFLFEQGRRSWVWLSYALLGAALLAKGPVCLLWVIAPLLVYALLSRDTRARAYLCDLPGWLLMLLIGSSWYLAVCVQEGWGIWQAVVQEDIVKKINGQGAEAWYAYLLYLGGDFFPFWLALLIKPRQLLAQVRERRPLLLLLCCALVPLLVFSLFTEKHAKYLLPVYPAIALLLAWHWHSLLNQAGKRWQQWLLQGLPVLVLAGFSLFYLAFEGRVFAHRIAAFAPLQAVAQAHPDVPAASLGEADMRLVYYLGRPVATMSSAAATQANPPAALLFVAGPLPETLQALAPCTLVRVEPYLKRKRAASLLGLGPLCPPRQ